MTIFKTNSAGFVYASDFMIFIFFYVNSHCVLLLICSNCISFMPAVTSLMQLLNRYRLGTNTGISLEATRNIFS